MATSKGETSSSPGPMIPQSLSIRGLLRHFSGERLHVYPLLWTQRQLELLQCRFIGACHECNDEEKPKEKKLKIKHTMAFFDELEDEWEVIRDAVTLVQGRDHQHRDAAIRRLLICEHLKAMRRRSLVFSFDNGRIRIPIPGSIFTGSPSPTSLTTEFIEETKVYSSSYSLWFQPGDDLYPIYLWLDEKPHITKRRKQYFRVPGGDSNEPVRAKHTIRLKRIYSSGTHSDPYIAVALIALAQAQSNWLQKHTDHAEASNKSFTARLLLSDKSGTSIRLYTAKISQSFLQKLADPSTIPDPDSCVEIFHEAIPLSPKDTFRQRLYARLFQINDHSEEISKEQVSEEQVSEKQVSEEQVSRETPSEEQASEEKIGMKRKRKD